MTPARRERGLGRRHGVDGLLKYTEARTVAHVRLMNFVPPEGMSFAWRDTSQTISLQAIKLAGMKLTT